MAESAAGPLRSAPALGRRKAAYLIPFSEELD
jgi:hypothetical protein